MACRAKVESDQNVKVDTWCGRERDAKGEPQEVCTLGDKTDAYHFVWVKNRKTYDQTVYTRGVIESSYNRALFQGGPVLHEKEWEEKRKLDHVAPGNEWTFNLVEIKKKSGIPVGREDIKTKIEYESSWNAGVRLPLVADATFSISTA
jgi:hypothetical protein